MKYIVKNRSLVKSADGVLENIEMIDSAWGCVDYLWVVDEPGTITAGDDIIEAKEKGILIKSYGNKKVAARYIFTPAVEFVEACDAVDKAEENTTEEPEMVGTPVE